MVYHRSIVRISKNKNLEIFSNCCLFLIIYIILNLIFYEYWYIINGILLFLLILIAIHTYFSKNENNITNQVIIAYPIDDNEVGYDDVITAEIIN
tara:strand:- start:47 stop:331 length:285 start_codon:yes stop_codon:yes gene_type:complete